jgi:hypothetical protein
MDLLCRYISESWKRITTDATDFLFLLNIFCFKKESKLLQTGLLMA